MWRPWQILEDDNSSDMAVPDSSSDQFLSEKEDKSLVIPETQNQNKFPEVIPETQPLSQQSSSQQSCLSDQNYMRGLYLQAEHNQLASKFPNTFFIMYK